MNVNEKKAHHILKLETYLVPHFSRCILPSLKIHPRWLLATQNCLGIPNQDR